MGIADDIVVCGSTESEHDQAFCKMLEATHKHNVSLNSEKLQFKQTHMDFFGHVLTKNGIQPVREKLEAICIMKTPSNTKEVQTIIIIIIIIIIIALLISSKRLFSLIYNGHMGMVTWAW